MLRRLGLLVVCLPALAAAQSAEEALFEDWTHHAGLDGVRGKRVTFADLDADGRPDAIIGCTRIFMNGKGGQFERSSTDGELLPEGARAPGCVQVGDINRDGRLDLFLGRSTDLSNPKFRDDGLRNELWLQGEGGSWRRVEGSVVGQRAETTITACFLDFNRDGRLDLFVGNAYAPHRKSFEASPDRLYRGKGDGTFVEVTKKAGLEGIEAPGRRESRKPTYGVTHGDWDNDGWQDLFVMTYGRQWNRLWRNKGDGTFEDVAAATRFDGDADRSGKYPDRVRRRTERPFRANGNTFDAALADFDGDGDLDCFLADITHWWAGSSSDPSVLLVNEGAKGDWKFRRDPDRIRRAHRTRGWNQGDLHAGWLDVDNDGRLDLVIASSDYPDDQILRLWHQLPDGRFEDWTARLGFRWMNASQISFADFDRDGATDILVGTSNMRLTDEQRKEHDLSVGLFRNTAAARTGNRFFNLRLGGQAIGARVTIRCGDRRQLREVQGGLGHAGHRDDTDCRFGVGKATEVDEVEVRWPDRKRTVQTFRGVATNRFYRLTRGGQLIALD